MAIAAEQVYVLLVSLRTVQSLISTHQRNEKISNKSSFGIIDIAVSSTTDRIIVIVKTARFIRDGACRWRSTLQTNLVSGSH